MTRAELYTNNLISIDGRTVGQVKAVTDFGQVQNATASRAQTKAQFRPMIAPATLGDPVIFDLPVYISSSPSSHKINPALIEAIKATVA
jgi:hypothetical protein